MSDPSANDLLARLQALPPEERARMLAQLGLAPAPPPAVSMGSGNQMGDVSMGDAAGRDVRKGIEGGVTLSDDATINGVAVGVNLGTIIYGRDPSEDERRQLVGYLQTLAAKLYRLPLRGIDDRLDRGEGLAMPRVYVTLTTTAKRLAITAVAAQERLILLGEPGSGKSTFLRHVAWVLAQCMLDSAQGQALLPAWEHTQPRMPVILPLRTLAERLDREAVADRAVTTALLDVLREHGVTRGHDLLAEALRSGAALLLFDGLDEVPLAAIPGTTVDRLALVAALHSFCRAYPKVRTVITCRTRAFAGEYSKMLGWPEETLTRFTPTQVRAFAEAWYTELTTQGQIDRAQAQRLTAILLEAVETNMKLNSMAGTPLLLTMMAMVLYNNGELPRDRPQLYEQVLKLLLGHWEKVRQGPSMSDAIGLPGWDSMRILPLLDQLSYQAHLNVSSRDGRGRLARSAVRDALETFFSDAGIAADQAAAAAVRCLDYFNQRSGLLVPDDAKDSYTFVHLTLQEHCAGRFIVLSPDAAALALQHRGDDRWHEPIALGLGIAQQYNPTLIDRVLTDLIDHQESGSDKPMDHWRRDLLLAEEIGQDRNWGYLRSQRVSVDRIQRDLRRNLQIHMGLPLALAENLQLGAALGRLGDPRFPVTTDQWRDELARRSDSFGTPAGYWCYVRPGAYSIGGWKESEGSAKIALQSFWIARLPITVAQYAPFVAEGYGESAKHWWTDEGWWWRQRVNRTEPWSWGQIEYSNSNQPVIGVTWYEAAAFCAWLSEHLRGALPDGYTVRLPTEAEWEAAADDGSGYRQPYPWGEAEPTPERAIYDESKLDRPAPVGCCPAGAATCGALDLAGNVWEWTTSSHKAYPAQSGALVEDFTIGEYDVPLRGGSWWSDRTHIRCEARDRYHPGDDYYIEDYGGMRVCVAPPFARMS